MRKLSFGVLYIMEGKPWTLGEKEKVRLGAVEMIIGTNWMERKTNIEVLKEVKEERYKNNEIKEDNICKSYE